MSEEILKNIIKLEVGSCEKQRKVNREKFYLQLAEMLNVYFQAKLNASDLILLGGLLENFKVNRFPITLELKKELGKRNKLNTLVFNNSTRKLVKSGILTKIEHRTYAFPEVIKVMREETVITLKFIKV